MNYPRAHHHTHQLWGGEGRTISECSLSHSSLRFGGLCGELHGGGSDEDHHARAQHLCKRGVDADALVCDHCGVALLEVREVEYGRHLGFGAAQSQSFGDFLHQVQHHVAVLQEYRQRSQRGGGVCQRGMCRSPEAQFEYAPDCPRVWNACMKLNTSM